MEVREAVAWELWRVHCGQEPVASTKQGMATNQGSLSLFTASRFPRGARSHMLVFKLVSHRVWMWQWQCASPRKGLFGRKWWFAQWVFFFHIKFFHSWTAGDSDTQSPCWFPSSVMLRWVMASVPGSSSLVESPLAVIFRWPPPHTHSLGPLWV